jgi:hypothetical protein
MQHRSPIVSWLLLAATLCVDYLALTWQADQRFPSSGYIVVAFHALILSQLSIVCIWSAISLKQTIWTRIAPLIAAAAAAIVTVIFTRLSTQFPNSSAFASCLGYYGLHAVLLMASIWLLQRTNFWRKRTGSTRAFQYSLVHVLIVMTVAAVLAALMRNNLFFGRASSTRLFNIVFVCSFVALAVASVVIWSLSWHWFLRMAGVFGIAVLLGSFAVPVFLTSMRTSGLSRDVFGILGAYYLIQALVLSIWLGIGPILPLKIDADAMQKPERLLQS